MRGHRGPGWRRRGRKRGTAPRGGPAAWPGLRPGGARPVNGDGGLGVRAAARRRCRGPGGFFKIHRRAQGGAGADARGTKREHGGACLRPTPRKRGRGPPAAGAGPRRGRARGCYTTARAGHSLDAPGSRALLYAQSGPVKGPRMGERPGGRARARARRRRGRQARLRPLRRGHTRGRRGVQLCRSGKERAPEPLHALPAETEEANSRWRAAGRIGGEEKPSCWHNVGGPCFVGAKRAVQAAR
jgi:hypothetical protein